MPELVLASQSAQRLKIIQTLSLPVTILPANIDEKAVPFTSPEQKAANIAAAKARKILSLRPQALIIAADTFCVCRNKILEKPSSLAEAQAMLRWQSGQEVVVLTGFAFLNGQTGHQQLGTVQTKIVLRSLTEAEIRQYCQTQPVLTWSAAFSPAYDPGMALVATIDGNATAFSHGLPFDKLVDFLRAERILVDEI